MSAQGLTKRCGNDWFDFKKLELEFTNLLPEYAENIPWGSKKVCISFSAKVLYYIEPEARRFAVRGNNKRWTIQLSSGENNEDEILGTVAVRTYNLEPAPIQPAKCENNKIELSVKHAGLLATQILCKSILPNLENGTTIFTPGASSVFCKEGLDDLMRDLNLNSADNAEKARVITSITQSCQDGGEHLSCSKTHIATCASISATQHMGDRRAATAICRETISRYLARGKEFDVNEFSVYINYIHGGMPAHFDAAILFTNFDDIQKLQRALLADAKRRVIAELAASQISLSSDQNDDDLNLSR